MSIKHMNDVWGTPFNATEKLVLLCIADCANDEGYAYPGYKKILEKTGLSKSTVAKAIYVLSGCGVLKVVSHSSIGQGKKVNTYTISSHLELTKSSNLELIEKIKDLRKDKSRAISSHLEPRKVHTSNPISSHLEHETPVLTPSNEPPVKEEKEIFSFWKTRFQKNSNSRFTDDRRRLVLARLKNYSMDDLKKAIFNCSRSKFHTENGYVDLTLICRSDSKLEFFRDMKIAQQPRRLGDAQHEKSNAAVTSL